MRVVRRSLGHGETDHELLWLTVSIGGFIAAAVWLAIGLPWPVCWFNELTGEPCATCGATRSVTAFFQGQFLASWRWNPLAFVGCVGVAVFDLYAAGVLITRSRRIRLAFSLTEKRLLRLGAVTALLLNWGYLLTHSSMFRD